MNLPHAICLLAMVIALTAAGCNRPPEVQMQVTLSVTPSPPAVGLATVKVTLDNRKGATPLPAPVFDWKTT
jgi:hypothetical protein